MPLPLIEEIENLFECGIGDGNVGMVSFDGVFGKDSAVEIRNVLADEVNRAGRLLKALRTHSPLQMLCWFLCLFRKGNKIGATLGKQR